MLNASRLPRRSEHGAAEPISLGQTFELIDKDGQVLGMATVSRVADDLVFGSFRPYPAYAGVEPLFEELVELVNQQLFSHADEVGTKIEALGLHLGSANGLRPPQVYNVQAFPDSITFRIKAE